MQAGLRSKLTAIMEIDKCSKADADKELKRIAEEGQITGQDIDWTDVEGDGEEKRQIDVRSDKGGDVDEPDREPETR